MAKSSAPAEVGDDANNNVPRADDDSSFSKDPDVPTEEDNILGFVWISICSYFIYRIIYYSYLIRMSAIDEYGPVIHEFDPYFNFRATEVRITENSPTRKESRLVVKNPKALD